MSDYIRANRSPLACRPVTITPNVNPYAEGSATCSFGNTTVLCCATIEDKPPRWLAPGEGGWVTAEYAMLPRSTHTRTDRGANKKGRAQEISRLVGRSLRGAADLAALEGYSIRVDCDVLVADGGTRTASISGGYVALALALAKLGQKPAMQVAAVSVGRVAGALLVDLAYEEDSRAELDLNLVMGPGGRLIEVQGTAEKGSFTGGELAELVEMGLAAAEEIFAAQTAALKG